MKYEQFISQIKCVNEWNVCCCEKETAPLSNLSQKLNPKENEEKLRTRTITCIIERHLLNTHTSFFFNFFLFESHSTQHTVQILIRLNEKLLAATEMDNHELYLVIRNEQQNNTTQYIFRKTKKKNYCCLRILMACMFRAAKIYMLILIYLCKCV